MAEEQPQRLQQLITMKKFSSLLVAFIILLCPLTAVAEDAIPAPDWVQTELNTDSSKTVIIKTPTYMIDHVDYYEYSTDGFLTVKKLSDPTGGEIRIDTTCEFSLRYYSDGVCSPVFSMTVVINKNTVISCHSTKIAIIIPNDSPIPKDITVSAFEIINGPDYVAADNAIDDNVPFRLYAVSVLRNGRDYSSDEPFYYLFPTEGYDVTQCKIYHMTEKGKVTLIDSVSEFNMLFCATNKTGMFIVAEDKLYSAGDLSGDGKVQAKDARLALRIAAKVESCNEKQLSAGDIDKNGKIDASDARKILRFAASLDII